MFRKVILSTSALVFSLSLFLVPISASTKNVSQNVPGSWAIAYRVDYTSNKISAIKNIVVKTAIGTSTVKQKRISTKSIDVVVIRKILGVTFYATVHNYLKDGEVSSKIN